MINIKSYKQCFVLIAVIIIFSMNLSNAIAGYTKKTSVHISGTIVGPNCQADTVDVNFGEVALNTIPEVRTSTARASGVSSKAFTVNLNCKGNVSGSVKYKFKGSTSSFNTDALATSMSGLGVMISTLSGSTKKSTAPNTWYEFDSAAGTHQMIASLVRDPAGTFSGGDFSSSATLEIQVP